MKEQCLFSEFTPDTLFVFDNSGITVLLKDPWLSGELRAVLRHTWPNSIISPCAKISVLDEALPISLQLYKRWAAWMRWRGFCKCSCRSVESSRQPHIPSFRSCKGPWRHGKQENIGVSCFDPWAWISPNSKQATCAPLLFFSESVSGDKMVMALRSLSISRWFLSAFGLFICGVNFMPASISFRLRLFAWSIRQVPNGMSIRELHACWLLSINKSRGIWDFHSNFMSIFLLWYVLHALHKY